MNKPPQPPPTLALGAGADVVADASMSTANGVPPGHRTEVETGIETGLAPSAVTWPEALTASLAAGFTHFRLRAIRAADGTMIERYGDYIVIKTTLEDATEHPGDFAWPSERLAFPLLHTVVPEGAFADTIVATYEFVRRPSVWVRLRAPEV